MVFPIRICFSGGIVSTAALLGLIHTTMLVIVSLSTLKSWSVSRLLEVCQIFKNPERILRLWELIKDYDDDEGGKWCLEHEVHFDKMVSEKYSHLKQYIGRPHPPKLSLPFHPNDGDIIYLMIR